MNLPQAYGTFIKRGDHMFRTSAYIQWGDSAKSIGACLLLNPGSARWSEELTDELNLSGTAQGSIRATDPTMKQLVRFMEKIHSSEDPINGRFHLYNLFSLQETASKKAIALFEHLVETGEYTISHSLIGMNELKSHPWILLGWGVERNPHWKNLELIKKTWMNLIIQSKVPAFGKKHHQSDDYYHPCPLIPTQQPTVLADLIKLYKETVERAALPPNKMRYTLLKWNKEYGANAKFIVLDNRTNMQSLFTPGRVHDLFWFHSDLSNDPAISNWDAFGEESFDDLEPIAF
ncbi:MAG: hypothetical protein J7639_05810 [Paenibacillaceae bacterium]|nr:hypothetical protein [Paenibacillaceae bacterium]